MQKNWEDPNLSSVSEPFLTLDAAIWSDLIAVVASPAKATSAYVAGFNGQERLPSPRDDEADDQICQAGDGKQRCGD
jgi:hypothetical protein